MYEQLIMEKLIDESFKINKNKTLELLKFGINHGDKLSKSILINGLENIIRSEKNDLKKLKRVVIKKTLF